MYTCISKSSDKALSCCLLLLPSCSLLHPHNSLEARCSPSTSSVNPTRQWQTAPPLSSDFSPLAILSDKNSFSHQSFYYKIVQCLQGLFETLAVVLGQEMPLWSPGVTAPLEKCGFSFESLVWIVFSHYTLKMKATGFNPLLCPCCCHTRIGFELPGSRRCRTGECPQFWLQSHSTASPWAKPYEQGSNRKWQVELLQLSLSVVRAKAISFPFNEVSR